MEVTWRRFRKKRKEKMKRDGRKVHGKLEERKKRNSEPLFKLREEEIWVILRKEKGDVKRERGGREKKEGREDG